jgi:hypothetical protein
MRYRLDEKRLRQMPPPSMSGSLEAKIDEVRRQFDMRVIAPEEALRFAHARPCDDRTIVREASR